MNTLKRNNDEYNTSLIHDVCKKTKIDSNKYINNLLDGINEIESSKQIYYTEFEKYINEYNPDLEETLFRCIADGNINIFRILVKYSLKFGKYDITNREREMYILYDHLRKWNNTMIYELFIDNIHNQGSTILWFITLSKKNIV